MLYPRSGTIYLLGFGLHLPAHALYPLIVLKAHGAPYCLAKVSLQRSKSKAIEASEFDVN